jgi:hypothetical protein
VDPKARRARAPFTCPGCGDVLVPHLGGRRARHFAHAPGASCPLTAPETALHFNAKERLLALCAGAFAGTAPVTLLTRCARCRRLDPRDLAALGDAAFSEGAVGPLRADVLVTAAGRPALALEVRVTHAVEPEKEAALAAAGVPAVELDAREEWVREPAAGAAEPLEIVCARTLGFPPCPACAAEARADADVERGGEDAQIAELERYRARGLFGQIATAPLTPAFSPRRARGEGDAGRSAVPPRAKGEARALAPPDFRCPDCGSRELLIGGKLVRHPCPGRGDRPVAWVGYDGRLVTLRWFSERRGS